MTGWCLQTTPMFHAYPPFRKIISITGKDDKNICTILANMPQHLRDTALDKIKVIAADKIQHLNSAEAPPGFGSNHYSYWNRFSCQVSASIFLL